MVYTREYDCAVISAFSRDLILEGKKWRNRLLCVHVCVWGG